MKIGVSAVSSDVMMKWWAEMISTEPNCLEIGATVMKIYGNICQKVADFGMGISQYNPFRQLIGTDRSHEEVYSQLYIYFLKGHCLLSSNLQTA